MKKTSEYVQEQFTYVAENNHYSCNHCDSNLSSSHTGNLKNHLKQHKEIHENVIKMEKEDPENAKKLKISQDEEEKVEKVTVYVSRAMLKDICVEMATLDGQPLNTFEKSATKKLLKILMDPLNMTVNRQNIKELIHKKADKIRLRISSIMQNRIYYLKADSATRIHRSVLGLNAQFYYKNKIRICTLAMTEIKKESTGFNLKNYILDALSKYNLSLKYCKGFVSDNGRNYVKAGKILEILKILGGEDEIIDYQSIEYPDQATVINAIHESGNVIFDNLPCWPHTLQLGVRKFFDQTIASELKVADEASKKLRTPTCRRLIEEKGLNHAHIRNVTRWSSTFEELTTLASLRTICELMKESVNQLQISNEEWDDIEAILCTLGPIHELTIKLQEEQLLASEAFVYLRCCLLTIKEMHNKYSDNLFEFLSDRSKNLLSEPAVLAAVLFDPRYSCLLSEQEVNSAISYIEQLSSSLSNKETTRNSTPTTREASAISAVSTSNLSSMIDKILSEATSNASGTSPNTFDLVMTLQKLSRYNLPRTVNVLDYWDNATKTTSHEFNSVAEIALICLSMPVGQVSVERAFSGLKFILDDLRYNLDGDLLDDILICFLNSDLFDKDDFED